MSDQDVSTAKSAGILFQEAQALGLFPKWETEPGLFSIEVKGQRHFFYYTYSVLNSQIASHFSRNKLLTYRLIEKMSSSSQISIIPYQQPSSLEDAKLFFTQYQPLIAKPVMGMMSKDVMLVEDISQLEQYVDYDYFLEQYIPGSELRCLVLAGKVIAGLDKKPTPLDGRPWKKHRKSLLPQEISNSLIDKSVVIARELKLNFCAVDFIINDQGQDWLLEVNSAPGIVPFHFPKEGPVINVAQKYWEETLKRL